MAEGRFGLCRMLLWLQRRERYGEDEASVVMPHPEYTERVDLAESGAADAADETRGHPSNIQRSTVRTLTA